MAQPELAEQAVVSMLDQLGIGLYRTDGTTIRAGTETLRGDFFLYEPEARGLADMLEQLDTDDAWMSFREFHAALAALGLQGSAQDLATAYADSYAAHPDEPMQWHVKIELPPPPP